MAGCQVESGEQLVIRLLSKDRPSLVKLSPEIIPEHGPRARELIEITGDANVGKTIQLLELLALTILPPEYGGKGASAIVIETNSDFHVPNLLAKILEKHILHRRMTATASCETEDLRAEVSNTEDVVLETLKNFTIFTCYNGDEFGEALRRARAILRSNTKVSLVAIDSIETFYWSASSRSQVIRIGTFLKQKLTDLKKLCDYYRIVVIYTRALYFGGRGQFNEINYRIELSEKSSNLFEARILSRNESREGSRCYEINDFGVKWLSSAVK